MPTLLSYDTHCIEIKGPMGDFCERGNEYSGSTKCWGVLEQLHKWRPLKPG
jgi:hypothetical protein